MRIDESNFRRLLDAYLDGTASPAERKLLDDFFDSNPHIRDRALSDDHQAKAAIWKKISGRLPSANIQEQTRRFQFTAWYRTAAVFALLATGYYFLIHKRPGETKNELAVHEQQTVTARGQRLKVELVDGSRVSLNSESKLVFPEKFTGATREVYLEGEAYFEVAHDEQHPFIVHTRVANTTVLGTSFNVLSSLTGETEITLVEGKVEVSSVSDHASVSQHQILSPNQQAIIDGGSGVIGMRHVDVSAYVDWKDNVLHFKDETLEEAAARLSAWYDVDISLEDPALAKCKINATYRKETLKNVLRSLEYVMKIGYRQEGKRIVLTGTGCK